MVSFFLLIIIALAVLYLLKIINAGKFRNIIMCGFIIRITLLIITYYDFFPVPDAHVDADNFHDEAFANQNGWNEYSTNYVYFLTFLYSITGCSRFFAQFFNLFLGVMTIIYIRKILGLLNVSDGVSKMMVAIASFLPFLNIYSVVLLRESWICFFITLSLYHFVFWYLFSRNTIRHMVLSIGSVIMAMWMHAGLVGVIVGYFIAFITYNRINNNVKISKSSYGAILIGMFVVFFLFLNMDVFLTKILTSDFIGSVEKRGEGSGGNSDYLTWLDLSSPKLVLLFSPLKMFYLLFSPVVLDWRGVKDLLAFFLDSLMYLIAIWAIITNKVSNSAYSLLKKYLLISLFVTVFAFSLGTSNSGTAIRHRAKVYSIILVVWAISASQRHERRNVIHCKNLK